MAQSNSTSRGPSYYKRGSIEVWDFIRDQRLNYHLGNAVKYICRAGYKDDAITDLRKAIHYLEDELHHVQQLYDQLQQPELQQPNLPRAKPSESSEDISECYGSADEFDR